MPEQAFLLKSVVYKMNRFLSIVVFQIVLIYALTPEVKFLIQFLKLFEEKQILTV